MDWLIVPMAIALVGITVRYHKAPVQALHSLFTSPEDMLRVTEEKRLQAGRALLKKMLAEQGIRETIQAWDTPGFLVSCRETPNDLVVVVHAETPLWKAVSLVPKHLWGEDETAPKNMGFRTLYQWRMGKGDQGIMLSPAVRSFLTVLHPVTIEESRLMLSLQAITAEMVDSKERARLLANRLAQLKALLNHLAAVDDPAPVLVHGCMTDVDAGFRREACRHALASCKRSKKKQKPDLGHYSIRDRTAHFRGRFAVDITTPETDNDPRGGTLSQKIIEPLAARFPDAMQAPDDGGPFAVTREAAFFAAVYFPEYLSKKELLHLCTVADRDMADLILPVLRHLPEDRINLGLSTALQNHALRSVVLDAFFIQSTKRMHLLLELVLTCPHPETRLNILSFLKRVQHPQRHAFVVEALPSLVKAAISLELRAEMVAVCLRILAEFGTVDDLPLVQTAREVCFTEDALLAHRQAMNAIAKGGNLQYEGMLSALDTGEHGGALSWAEGGGALTRLGEEGLAGPDRHEE
ncbi:hypothetical protein [Acanthopleuribacter pedis]|uniref:Uncharacterized protein n=1 Tax=Acanthopleuribacter pedis TaxID=442870 RepID=A0A8J7Q4H2_9BACT|nr:hypothetical protein [Acanthopleuribacter pedis]MBO1317907.1 hypothetical protein [Acanthopleuribacter pedis]